MPPPETMESLFEWVSVSLLLLTFVAGYGVVHFSNKVTEKRDEQLRQFGLRLSEQQERAANAEKALLALQMQRLPRSLKFDSNDSLQELIASLSRTPSTVEILYKNGDGEASWFAEQIRGLLLSARWIVPRPAPIPDSAAANAVEQLKAGVDGVTLITKHSSGQDKPASAEALLGNLLAKSLGSIARSPDANLPDNFIRIIVLQKP